VSPLNEFTSLEGKKKDVVLKSFKMQHFELGQVWPDSVRLWMEKTASFSYTKHPVERARMERLIETLEKKNEKAKSSGNSEGTSGSCW